jgi:hypothetical protein
MAPGAPYLPGDTTYVDEQVKFRTYFVVEYDDNNNVQTSWAKKSLFTIGYLDWAVNFYATRTQILDPYRVVAQAFVRSNVNIFNTKPPPAASGLGWYK